MYKIQRENILQRPISMILSFLPSFSKCMRKNIYHGLSNKHWVCHSLRKKNNPEFDSLKLIKLLFFSVTRDTPMLIMQTMM